MAPPPHLTPAQLAVAAERRAAREAKRAAQAAGLDQPIDEGGPGAQVLKREWISLQRTGGGRGSDEKGLRVISWNILAQTLIRRDLFPGSDSLRWGDRKSMLEVELAHYGRLADILCLQECDRLPDLIQSMPYDACVQAKGRGKQHGLVVLYRSERFAFKGSKTVYLDEEELSPASGEALNGNGSGDASGRGKRGGTRQTKNVGLIVGLEDKQRSEGGVIIITAHLFWHPMYQYERVRQFIVLLRALRAFQKEHGLESWPAVMAGDFNASPCEAPYQLLVAPSAPLPPATLQRLEESRVIHNSVDKLASALSESTAHGASIPVSETSSTTATGAKTPTTQSQLTESLPEKDDEGEGGGAADPAAKTRAVEADDGILTVEELQNAMCDLIGAEGLRSAYDHVKWQSDGDVTFASRDGWPDGSRGTKGDGEPGYTCYTALFQLTLDYLFIIPLLAPSSDAANAVVQVRQVLRPARKAELGKGLPMKGISASDHLAVGCELVW